MGDWYDFRTQSLIRIRGEDGLRDVSLSALLARLTAEQETEILAVQAHQQHALHAFLVQLGALHLDSGPSRSLPTTAAAWEEALLALSGGEPDAWKLVVDDLSKPALLQPPVLEGSVEKFSVLEAFDELDILSTAKNHDVKGRRMGDVPPDIAFVTLLTLQTTQGFSGRDNYGIVRMNGGFSSRASVGLAREDSLAVRFARDAIALAATAKAAAERGWAASGVRLVWTVPWDGTTSLSLGECHPFCIEVCRRVRLSRTPAGTILARGTSSKAPRLSAPEAKGNLGDFWLPVSKVDGKARTFGGNGFSYDVVHDLLLADTWTTPAMISQKADGSAPKLVLRTLVRGQGITEGYHERVIPVPGRAFKRLFSADGRAAIASLSSRRIERIDAARMKILKPALLVALQGAPDKLNFKDDRVDSHVAAFEEEMDSDYFEHLFDDAEEDAEVADERYERLLRTRILSAFLAAIPTLPIPDSRRMRAAAVARNTLDGLLAKHLPLARPARELVDPLTTGDHP